MPTLDNCINNVFVPGNIPASSGTTPVTVPLTSVVDPNNYDPSTLTYSLDQSKFYNSLYAASIY